jgi:hypothetical protein
MIKTIDDQKPINILDEKDSIFYQFTVDSSKI